MEINGFLHPAVAFIALAMALPFFRGQHWKWLLLVPPIIAIAVVFTATMGSFGVIPYLGNTLILGRVDKLSLVFANVFAIQSLIGMIYAFHLKDKAHHASAALYVAGAFGCVFAGDYLTLFIFWELMAVASTFLIWLHRTKTSSAAGYRYFLFHMLGGLFLLGGLLLRYHEIGTFAFLPVDPSAVQYYDWLILIGFCVNAAVVPLHAWLPDAYPEATIPGAVFMCAFTTKTAVYVLARGFSGVYVLAIAGTFMAVYGVLYASMENNARRILSYHIVSQVGYMVAGIGIGTALCLNGAIAHAYAHILYKGLLFMSVGTILFAVGTADLDKLGGLVGKLPWLVILYMVGAVSISGMPFFNGFISKTMTITGAAESHNTLIAIGLEIAAVGTFLSVGIKLPYFAFFHKPAKTELKLNPIPKNMYVAMAIAATLCFAQGVYPQMLYSLLPFPVEYTPYTPWHLLQSAMLLAFTGAGFWIMRKVIVPHHGRNLDFDKLYRWIGNTGIKVVCRPVAWVDSVWTTVYRVIGLRALMDFADGSSWFDRKGIDTVVDGTAYTVRNIGRTGAKIQTGRIQDYLGMAVFFALCIYGLVWYFG
ncbi:Na(+)/H(+) antiporter subunit D [Maridesulfovibrio ferrireducens]|uniref:Multisubunit sodium/proton antiporter, MrpD subunit n=1 Tax=Maridesulfovibrio ferrireducens TaxID=246191 RepID=A0A1G9EH28_9BACT|nr:Na(+)/H(+) antiporter subunit D [Maridesulfovibrio ferrireducens]MBI9111552.1 Na(+)/H(+) antiporter subunit D [Maridesulfovibrio ferrireducens]SDK75345.1 multisubunit sodium/proton antiporter, MrpD subunit [Maridesulfovibrio ferrireducens]